MADDILTSNSGYAEVPEGFVFVPTNAPGDPEIARALLAAADNPDDVIARPGYGYVVPKAVATKAKGLKAGKAQNPIDPSTPDTHDDEKVEQSQSAADQPESAAAVQTKTEVDQRVAADKAAAANVPDKAQTPNSAPEDDPGVSAADQPEALIGDATPDHDGAKDETSDTKTTAASAA